MDAVVPRFTELPLPATSPPAAVVTSPRLSLVLHDGQLLAWGELRETFAPEPVSPAVVPDLAGELVGIAAAGRAGYAITADGAVYSFGVRERSALLRGTDLPDGEILRPARVELPPRARARAIHAGYYFAAIVPDQGTFLGGDATWCVLGPAGDPARTQAAVTRLCVRR